MIAAQDDAIRAIDIYRGCGGEVEVEVEVVEVSGGFQGVLVVVGAEGEGDRGRGG